MIPFTLPWMMIGEIATGRDCWIAAMAAWIVCTVAFCGHGILRSAWRLGVATPRPVGEIFGGMAIGTVVGASHCLKEPLGLWWSIALCVLGMVISAGVGMAVAPRIDGNEGAQREGST